jgi:hypothetical protein
MVIAEDAGHNRSRRWLHVGMYHSFWLGRPLKRMVFLPEGVPTILPWLREQ